MDYLITAAKTGLALFCMSLLIPAVVLAGSGSLKQAMRALREWWTIMGIMSVIVGAIGFWVWLIA